MNLRPGLVRTVLLDVEATREEARRAGYTTFVLPAESIVDRASFFDAIRAPLPLDPPLVSFRSWDAMSDSLWEGLYSLPARRIAILWPNARTMASMASADFEVALSILTDVSNLLANPRTESGPSKELAVVVE